MNTQPLPKVEIHCHVEGTAHPDLVRKVAERNNLSLDGLFNEDGSYRWHDFTSFLNAYDKAAAVFVNEQDYSDMTYDYFTRSADEGMIYGEVFISADHAEGSGLSYRAYVDALADGIERARAQTGVEGRMIATCVRHYGPERAEPVAQLCVKYPHPMVTGFGMGGDERMHHPREFAQAFAVARDAGLDITAHAGEFGGPTSVRAALDELGIRRVGHGVRAIEDPELVKRLADEQIVLETCPGSNISLEVFPDWQSHPFLALRAAGVPVTLNSDDPPFFNTTIGAEYEMGADEFGLSSLELLGISRLALQSAFVDDATRQQLLQRLDTYASTIGG